MIIEYMPCTNLLDLALASHHFQVLTQPQIYSEVIFDLVERKPGQRRRGNHTKRQRVFVDTINSKPELGKYCKKLVWPWVEGTWRLFSLLPNVRVLQLLSHGHIDEIPRLSFRFLRHVLLSGRFPVGALEAIGSNFEVLETISFNSYLVSG